MGCLYRKIRVLVLLIIFSSCANEPPPITQNHIPKGSVFGIDISHHQGEIDWAKVKEWNGHKINFVYIKATEGSTHLDKKYLHNIKEAKKQGFLVGSG